MYVYMLVWFTIYVYMFTHREVLAFATEPIFMSLANVLGRTDHLPGSVISNIKGFKLYDVEIKYGLLQVSNVMK
jgi:hypothetical protein